MKRWWSKPGQEILTRLSPKALPNPDAAKTYPDSDDPHFLEFLNEFVAAYRPAP